MSKTGHSFAMFLQAIGASLLSLTMLRWLGFLGLPPVFYLLLLLVGMPIGGVIAARGRVAHEGSFARWNIATSFVALGCAVAFIVVAQLSATEIGFPGPDVGRALGLLFLRSTLIALALLPLFIAFGALELAAYRDAARVFGGSLSPTYAFNLAGLLVGYAMFRSLLPRVGTTSLGLIGMAALWLAAASLSSRRWHRWVVASALLGAAVGVPFESLAFSWLETKSGPSTLRHWNVAPNHLIYDKWGRYCRLSIVETSWGIVGFYDGMTYWLYRRQLPSPRVNPDAYRDLDIAFSKLVQPGDRVAVLGAGGGVQVGAALRAGASRVIAVEVVPEVLDALSGPLSDQVENVYRDQRVELVRANARRYLARTDERFDLIVLASVESHLSGLRSLFEPAQVMFTQEALSQMVGHLAPGGVLAISKFTAVDQRGVVFAQCFQQLELLGLSVTGFIKRAGRVDHSAQSGDLLSDSTHYLIAAHVPNDPRAIQRDLSQLQSAGVERVDEAPEAGTSLPITDDRAFATGMLVNSIGLHRVAAALIVFALIVSALGVVLKHYAARWIEPSTETMNSWRHRLPLAATLAGMNFMLIEYLVIYRLLDRLDVPMDATMIGIVAFAGLAASGALLTVRVPEPIRRWGPAGVALLLGISVFDGRWSLFAGLAASVVTGWLFPRLLEAGQARISTIYVWDAYGAMWGGIIALLVPLFLGFRGFQVAAALALLATSMAIERAVGRPHAAAAESAA